MNDDVINLFNQGKLLARAMEYPSIHRNYGTKDVSYDFSIWADECEEAKKEGLKSLSTTLLVSGEPIPTYKSIGFLLNSEKTEVRHISEMDSGSCGNEKNGDFKANTSGIQTLLELKNIIKSKHENVMNEVNVNMGENAYIGLFANKITSQLQIARMLLAQKYYELQTGIALPMYIYDSKIGNLENYDVTLDEKASIIKHCLENKLLRSSSIFYETQGGECKCVDYLKEIKKDIESRNFILQSAIEVTKEITRIGTINIQAQNIKDIQKLRDEKYI